MSDVILNFFGKTKGGTSRSEQNGGQAHTESSNVAALLRQMAKCLKATQNVSVVLAAGHTTYICNIAVFI
jgi:hypothetical protein